MSEEQLISEINQWMEDAESSDNEEIDDVNNDPANEASSAEIDSIPPVEGTANVASALVQSNAKAILSSTSYVEYLRSCKAKKDAIVEQKKERKKDRLKKAEEKLEKLSKNVKNLRSQVDEHQ